MTFGRWTFKSSGRLNYFAALVLLFAFAVSGWKILNRLPAANYSTELKQASQPSNSSGDRAADLSQEQPQPSSDGPFQLNANFVSNMPGQAVHAASMVELRDGRVRAVWFSGSKEGAGDVTIQTAVMNASTFMWEPERTLFDRQKIQRGLWRYVKKLGNPVISRNPDGSLSLWMVNVSLGGWAGSAITWSRSVDEGATWSEPRRLVTSPFLNISTLVKGAPVALVDGQINLPVYHEFVTKFGEILRISPKGQVVDKIRIPESQSFLQPVVLVTSPQQAQVYMRSGLGKTVMASETVNAGKTWTAAHAIAWPNPDSALAGVITDRGTQWLALNPTTAGRANLALLQADKGGTFDGATPLVIESSNSSTAGLSASDFERLLGNELQAKGASQEQTQAYVASAKRQLCRENHCSQEYSYPFLLQTSDGFIHLLYTWHRTRIKHVRFDPVQSSPRAEPTSVNSSESSKSSKSYESSESSNASSTN